MTRSILANAAAAAGLLTATAAAGLMGLSGLAVEPAFASDLVIEVREVRSDAGHVYIAVHTPREGAKFPYPDGMFTAIRQQARAGDMRFMLGDLPPGRYAVNAFHDENGNGDLDTNVLGIPTEGFGFANDPSATFGPPEFEEAAVTVGGTPVTAAMTITY